MSSGNAMPGISEGEISSRAGTPAFETAATAGIPLAIAEEEQEPTLASLQAHIAAQRTRRHALEQELSNLQALNTTLNEQLQLHAEANELARQRILRLEEESLGLLRVNNGTLTQLVAAQRQIIEMQQEHFGDLQARFEQMRAVFGSPPNQRRRRG